MLDKYTKTNEFAEEIGEEVLNNPVYKADQKEYTTALERLLPDFEDYDTIDELVNQMESITMELAFKKGFQDGAKFVIDCLAANRTYQTTELLGNLEIVQGLSKKKSYVRDSKEAM